jgi:hypothetical protein
VELLQSVVVYDGLPISSGGAHGLGKMTADAAFSAWTHFLETCTRPSPVECWFEFPRTPEVSLDAEIRRRIVREFPPRDGKLVVPSHRFQDALALFASLQPLPVNQWGMGPVWLWFSAEFQVRSPNSTALWRGQDPARFGDFRTPGGLRLGRSSTRLIVHAKRSMGLALSLPSASDADLVECVPWLAQALPMRLSAKQWTRWTLAKNGRTYRPTKITPTPATP